MIGNIVLTGALLASVFSIVMYYLSFRGYSNTLKPARIGYHLMTILIIVASAMLLAAILSHNYEYKYVFNYSNSDLSTGLLMSTFYAGQEGSFMLWLLFTAIVGLVLLEYTSKRDDLEPRVMMVFTLAVGFLLLMISPMLKNPFTYIWAEPTFVDIKHLNQSFLSLPFINNFIFEDPNSRSAFIKFSPEFYSQLTGQGYAISDILIKGKGLNPLLQNFWMQIHPPILFIGFAMSTVPFAFAFAALLKNEYRDWVKQALPWVIAGAMILGLAIMLGGYWAYGVLGWGGYWGWDPVENSSLVPWIIGVASIHTLLIQRKTGSKENAGRFGKTNLILCIMTYLLVLYSTFLTRSGILGDASVHSFGEPANMVYWLLILFVLSFTFIGLGGIVFRWKYLDKYFDYEENVLSRELALFTGAVALIASAIIILVGTSAPIFGQSVQISFYNELNIPIAIIMGFLNGFSLLLKWKYNKSEKILTAIRNPLIAAVVGSLLIIFIGGVYDIILIILTLSATFTLAVNGEIALKIFKGRKSFTGAYITHMGFALFILGAIATGSFTKDKQITLPKGEPKEVMGHQLTFTGYDKIPGTEKFAFNIEINDGSSTSSVAPVMYVAEFNNSLMREPDILNRLTSDFYISPVSYDSGNNQEHNHNHSNSATLGKGQTYSFNGSTIKFVSFNFPPETMAAMQEGKDFFIGANIEITSNGKTYKAEPKLKNSGGKRSFVPAEIKDANLKIDMSNLDASGTVSLSFSTLDGTDTNQESIVTETKPKEVLSIEASIKPFINLVWAGVLIMVAGFSIATFRRTKESMK